MSREEHRADELPARRRRPRREDSTKVAALRLSLDDHGRWVLSCDLLETGQESFGAPRTTITADLVVLAAGTLGSTEIPLRSKGIGVSDDAGLKVQQ